MVRIEVLIDDSGRLCGYVAKGEYTRAQMASLIREYEDKDFQVTKYYSVETGYFRWIPEPPNSDAPYSKRISKAEPGRGAFLATVVSFI